jgi:DNA-binding HxlR family transcriptional regulator
MTPHMTVQLAGQSTRGHLPLGDQCPIDRTLRVIGNRSALLLLRETFFGATRFNQLRKGAGITPAVAAQRLRELVAAGVLEQQPYRDPGQRTRSEYVLTPRGHALMPIVLGLIQWGSAHAPKGCGAEMTHAACGAHVSTVAYCAAGHVVDKSEVIFAFGATRV